MIQNTVGLTGIQACGEDDLFSSGKPLKKVISLKQESNVLNFNFKQVSKNNMRS